MCLNPFFFRARFPTGPWVTDYEEMGLNPFFFRARFPTIDGKAAAIKNSVLIPFSSGQGFQRGGAAEILRVSWVLILFLQGKVSNDSDC